MEYRSVFLKRLPILFLLFSVLGHTQNGEAFAGEVVAIQKKYDSIWDAERPTIVFTGSSSIRMWYDLDLRFPDQQVLNTGFGGSQFSDLQRYLDELVLDYRPVKVFIYEGDNDISARKRQREIIETAENVIERLRDAKEDIQIVLISPKPSISRWNLRGKYKRLNRKLSRLAGKYQGVEFVDIWNPMLNGRKLNQELFLEDGLHLNAKGYDIWYDQLKNHVEP